MGLVKLQGNDAVEFRIPFPFSYNVYIWFIFKFAVAWHSCKLSCHPSATKSPDQGWNAELEAGRPLEVLFLINSVLSEGPRHRPQCFQSQGFLPGISLVLAIGLCSTKPPTWLLPALHMLVAQPFLLSLNPFPDSWEGDQVGRRWRIS